jgi:peptide/nickel transport system substrate-binding protein
MRLRICVLRLVAVSIALLFVSSAFAGPPEPCTGGVFKIAQNAYPPNLDWQANTATATREIGMNVFESLVSYNKKFEIAPMLAERWEVSPDGLTYTFHLRQGRKFHNGKEMTSEDVVASLKRFLAVGRRKGDLAMVKDVVAVDAYTVRFDLEHKTGVLLASLGSPIGQVSIMPKEVVYEKDGKTFVPADKLKQDAKHLIGTGPYKFNKWLRDRYISMTCFADYEPMDVPGEGLGGHRVGYYKEIRFYKVAEPAARIAGVETGQYHFGDRVPYDLAMKVKDKPGVVVTRIAPFTWPVIYFNYHPNPDGTPSLFSNLKMRQAVQAALDHEAIMKVAGTGPGRVDPGLMFQEQIWHTDAGKELYNQVNPDKAKQLLKEAGYQGQTVRIMTNQQYAYMYKTAIALESQLKAIGMNTEIIVTDWPATTQRWKSGGYWDIGFSGISTRFDPSNHNILWHTKMNNYGYSNPEVDRLVEAGMAESDFQKRYEIYKQLQQITYEDVIFIKEFDDNIYQIHTAKMKNYTPWYLIRVWNTWLEE